MFERYLDDIDNYSSDKGAYLDVPFVPTDDAVVDAMLELANVGPKDVLYDLGSGDGRIVVSAAKDWGARGVGIDIDSMRIAEAMEYAELSQVEGLTNFVEDDIFTADFGEASAVTLYLLQSINEQLRPRLLSELRPGTRVVSHAFDMGKWKADEIRTIGSVNIYKWIVPANVAGVWPPGTRSRASATSSLNFRIASIAARAGCGIRGKAVTTPSLNRRYHVDNRG